MPPKSSTKGEGSKGADKQERRVDEMLTTSSDAMAVQDQIIQDGDLQKAMKLSSKDRSEVTLRLLFSIKSLVAKIDPMNEQIQETKQRVSDIEESLNQVHERVEELEHSRGQEETRDKNMDDLKTKLQEVEHRLIESEKKNDDLENRSRRINLNFYNFPEGVEKKDKSCAAFVSDFILKHMKVEGVENNMAIQRAHRTPSTPLRNGKPRRITVAFVDASVSRTVLFAAPKSLKNNKFEGENIFVTDDVSQAVVKERKRLLEFRKDYQKENPRKKSYIAWKVPATCMVEMENGKMEAVTVNDLKNRQERG